VQQSKTVQVRFLAVPLRRIFFASLTTENSGIDNLSSSLEAQANDSFLKVRKPELP
jgi:hypothetical protein